MAKATVTCTCATCGATFQRFAIKRNRADADSWEKWAAENIDECPQCYAARRAAEREEQLKSYVSGFSAAHPLPKITGVSEKQIAYASSLRTRFVENQLMRNNADIAKFFDTYNRFRPDALSPAHLAEAKECAQQAGQPFDAWYADQLQTAIAYSSGVPKAAVPAAQLIFAESNASKLIDALR